MMMTMGEGRQNLRRRRLDILNDHRCCLEDCFVNNEDTGLSPERDVMKDLKFCRSFIFFIKQKENYGKGGGRVLALLLNPLCEEVA